MNHFAIRVDRYIDRRRHKHHRARKRIGNLKQIPGFLERMRPLEPDVKDGYRLSRPTRQDHWPRLRYVARPARPVDRECHMLPFLEPLRHHRQPFNRTARRTSLRRSETKPLDYAARPLPIEVHSVHHHDPAIPPNPDRWENATV